MDQELDKETLITLTSDIVAAHVSNNSVSVDDVPSLIGNVYSVLAGLGTAPVEEMAPPEPAVSIRASIRPDYIVCLEDGKKLKMLKRHLMTHYNLTPDEYRRRWNLPADYPMVAPNYAARRRELAKTIGLGRKPATTAKAPAAAAETKPKAKAATGRKTATPKAATPKAAAPKAAAPKASSAKATPRKKAPAKAKAPTKSKQPADA